VKITYQQFLVKNGLFSTDTNAIQKETIRAIVQESTLGMKFLGLATISILTGNNSSTGETKSKNYLFPFLNKKENLEYLDFREILIGQQSYILCAFVYLKGTPVKKFKIIAPSNEAINYLTKLLEN
jgi:hypothetical protein